MSESAGPDYTAVPASRSSLQYLDPAQRPPPNNDAHIGTSGQIPRHAASISQPYFFNFPSGIALSSRWAVILVSGEPTPRLSVTALRPRHDFFLTHIFSTSKRGP